MFRIINFTSLIRYVAVATTVITILIYEAMQSYWPNDSSIIRIISMASLTSIIVIFLITANLSARRIWKLLRYFDSSLYPDLNGTWEGEIITEEGKKIIARAIIRQTILQTQIDIHTETSKSLTLETTPAIESGQCKLYYMYKSIPKNPNWNNYTGSTIFDVRNTLSDSGKITELSGYYFSDRKTNGRIKFKQINDNTESDVSFY